MTPRPFRAARGISFSFTLDAAESTSAGVYNSQDELIRTLWRGEPMGAGTTTRAWDQKDDAGNVVPAGNYTVRLIHSGVVYSWDGCVGNSSYRGGIGGLHTMFNQPTCLVSVPGKVYYTGGYNESQPAFGGFNNTTPQVNDQVPAQLDDPFVSASQFTVDETRLYFVSYGGIGNVKSFVFALDLGTGARSGFSSGTPLCLNYMDPPTNSICYYGQNYSSNRTGSGGVICLKENLSNVPSGIAVQRYGIVLAVAYPDESLIRLFNKITGAELGAISTSMLQNPPTATLSGKEVITWAQSNQIAMTAEGDLWAITSTNTLKKFTNLDTTPLELTTITIDTTDPLALAVDPLNGNSIWVVDGGERQQVKNFTGDGALRRTIGQLGGSLTTALLSGDKFNFLKGDQNPQSAIAVDTLGNVWVVDTGNSRTLKFMPGIETATDSIQYRAVSYCSAVDTGNPTRVFSNYLEFSVDYSKPLSDPASWSLVRNWLTVMPDPWRGYVTETTGFSGFTTVRTLPNGRTYALTDMQGTPVMFELTPDDQLRTLPALRARDQFSNANPFGAGTLSGGDTTLVFYENGDLGYSSNLYPTQEVKRLALAGFDGSNNPTWSLSPTKLASIPLYAADYEKTPQYNWAFTGVIGPRFPMTATNKVVYFNNSPQGDGMHLGVVDLGGTSFKWKASPAGYLDFRGAYQTDTYGAGLQYAGNIVYALDRHIIYGYHGEFYRDSNNQRVGQANQFMHFYDNGLFIGQFGVPSTQAPVRQRGSIGNAFSWSLVSHNDSAYIYSNDESTFGGVTRWKISGMDSIGELSALCATGNSTYLS